MKRILFAVAIVLVAASAFAAADRDVLITADGTVYSIAAQLSEDGLSSSLALTVQAGDKATQSVVPESATGFNGQPTLTYDADAKTLFVVWTRQPSATTNELLVTSYSPAGKWGQATVIDSNQVVRSNLSIRFTRQVQTAPRDGNPLVDAPALILHAAWWQKGLTGGESPEYAVIPLSGGYPRTADIHDLTEFVDLRDVAQPIASDFMRHVALLAGPTPDAVDAIFSDSRTNSFYRVTLRPIAEARVHITVGVRGPKLGEPRTLAFDWSGQTGTISSPDGNTVIFTNTTSDRVSWITLNSNGDWLPLQSLALNDKVTVSTAMAALARLAASSSE